MGSPVNLVALDGQATPVSQTFNPLGVDPDGVAQWVNRVGGISIGFPRVKFAMRMPNKGSRNYKITRSLVIPILEQTSASTATGIQPAPTVAYNMVQNSEWIIPERSSAVDRSNLLALAKNIDALTFITDAVKNYEPVY